MKYGQGEDYPLHMPGHKRKLCGEMPPQIFQMDITEIDGFDNLHEPEGIIADLQKRIAAFYGADESYCLVGSSTAGILSAISAAIPMGGHILMARNSHKSAYHAAYLRRLRISYLTPRTLDEYGIADCLTPQQVAEALDRENDIDAVFIVSPTYEGRISPIREIAEVVHARGKILIVDAAHGAHLVLKDRSSGKSRFGDEADLVIQSLHKTLPAPTQTAVLHVCGELVSRERLQRFLRIYQSSSPSYVLMAGIDNCVTIMENEGIARYQTFVARFEELVKELRKCKNIRIFATEFLPGDGNMAEDGKNHPEFDGKMGPESQDIGKLLMFPDGSLMTGRQLYDILRERYHLQLEMAAEHFCLAMFTVGDTQEGFQRLLTALREIDRELSGKKSLEEKCAGETYFGETSAGETWAGVTYFEEKSAGKTCAGETCSAGRLYDGRLGAENGVKGKDMEAAEVALPLYQAWDLEWEEVSLEDCVGRIAADFVNLYPPGTPILVPGERFTRDICKSLIRYQEQGLHVQGVRWNRDGAFVRCVTVKTRNEDT